MLACMHACTYVCMYAHTTLHIQYTHVLMDTECTIHTCTAHRHPNGLVGDLIKALVEIERKDVAESLRYAVKKEILAKKGWWH